MMSPLPTVGQANSLISQEESHRGIIAGGSSNVSNMPAAFYSNTSNYKGKADSRCEYCGWTGQTKENCYKLIGYPPGHRLYKGNQKKGGNFNAMNQKNADTSKKLLD
ncbi:hypothetical protein CFOL_v3_31770 [Cephalotus follicularis]|uniref:CCHC-type domain-containing protein n=1 Tax=Cephalotus follicularis TaxID=3775 RepID=A0A1Q3D768_CEPFO|nr:hypothetical protein CFOL_v3_31770 [Cephalotus follicularis]